MKQLIKFAASFLITVLIFASCNKQKDLQQQNNKPPVANAGSDKTIILPTDSTQLTGIGTDVDGAIVKFEWTKFSGPVQYRFGNSTDATTTVKDLVEEHTCLN